MSASPGKLALRPKADLVIRNIGELLTMAGHSKEPVVKPSEESLAIAKSQGGLCVASSSGRICYIGVPQGLVEHVDVGSAVEVDAMGKAVVPGFVDSHTHALFAGSREEELSYKISGLSYLEILSRGGGILKTVRETRLASDETLAAETSKRLDRMTEYGTTTFEIKTGYGLSVKEEIRLLRLIGVLKDAGYDIEPTLLSAHAVPEEYSDRAGNYVDEVVLPTIDEASKAHLARFCDVFLEKGVFGRAEARSILEYAKKKRLAPKLHADEFSDLGGAKLASELDAVSADHLLCASNAGIRALAKRKTMCVLLPGTSFSSFAPAYANAREIISKGAPVALATDMSPNSWIESMQFVISLSCYGMKMTPEEALIAATINGAHAIRRSHEVGSIEVGKHLDAVVTSLCSYREIPYRIAGNCARVVIKKGKVVHEAQLDD